MVGAICKWDVLVHPVVTIQCFGLAVFLRTLLAGRHQTFLSLVAQAGAFQAPQHAALGLIRRCADLERRGMWIYRSLACRFEDRPSVAQFFDCLASQEEAHGDLLELCRAAVSRGRWEDTLFAPWKEALPHLEKRMAEFEASLDRIADVPKALRLVIQVESSEINQVFASVVAASDSDFVRALRAFRNAGQEHIAFIRRTISELEPDLTEACQALRTA